MDASYFDLMGSYFQLIRWPRALAWWHHSNQMGYLVPAQLPCQNRAQQCGSLLPTWTRGPALPSRSSVSVRLPAPHVAQKTSTARHLLCMPSSSCPGRLPASAGSVRASQPLPPLLGGCRLPFRHLLPLLLVSALPIAVVLIGVIEVGTQQLRDELAHLLGRGRGMDQSQCSSGSIGRRQAHPFVSVRRLHQLRVRCATRVAPRPPCPIAHLHVLACHVVGRLPIL